MRKLDYNHELLKTAVQNSRSLNISKICRDLHISRQTFYNVIDGDNYVSVDVVVAVSERLGFTRDKILKAPKTSPAFAETVP